MPMQEIDRTSTLDQGQEGAFVREDAEEEPGIGGHREHGHKSAEQEVDSDEEEEEDQAPATAPPPFATAVNAKKTFGMRRPNPSAKRGVNNASYSTSYLMGCQIGNDAYNYEDKYPEDAPYEEASPNARVWKTYEDERRIHDANMVEESRDNVDVLLVFVSPVVTLLSSLFSRVKGGSFLGRRDDICRPNIAEFAARLRRYVCLSTLRIGPRPTCHCQRIPGQHHHPFFPQSYHRFCSRYHGCLGERTLVH